MKINYDFILSYIGSITKNVIVRRGIEKATKYFKSIFVPDYYETLWVEAPEYYYAGATYAILFKALVRDDELWIIMYASSGV